MIGLFGFALAAVATPPAKAVVSNAAPFRVQGLRHARFGMTEAQVRAAVAQDFGAGAVIQPIDLPEPGKHALKLDLLRLDPAPGLAHIYYVLGADGRLCAVNIGWETTSTPTADERRAMINGALRLQRYFHDQPAKPLLWNDGGILGHGTILLYHAEDGTGGIVELTVAGVPAAGQPEGATGPAQIKLSYMLISPQQR